MAELVHQAHVAPWKRDEVERLKELIKSKPVVALIGIGGIPSPQMLNMRAMLREHGELRSGKNNLFKLAFEDITGDLDGIGELLDHLEGQAAILATDANPFKLFKQLEKTKQMMPAKAGDIAPTDIVVEKGDTGHPPGPLVGELQQAGIPAAIEGGGVVIKKTTTVVKAGEEISDKLAAGLAKLDINPIEVGLQLLGVYEDGFVFKGDDLKIDEVAFGSDLVRAIQSGINLGVNAPVVTPELAPLIIGKAHREALNLAVEIGHLSKESTPLVIGKAMRQALGVAGELDPEALDEDLQTKLAGAAAASAAAASAPAAGGDDAPAEEEEEEEEEVSEDEAAEGLGALFG